MEQISSKLAVSHVPSVRHTFIFHPSRHTHTHTHTFGSLSLWGLSMDVMVCILNKLYIP